MSDITIDVASWALSLEKTKARVASENIANKNILDSTQKVDFSRLIGALTEVMESREDGRVRDFLAEDVVVDRVTTQNALNRNSLDAQVADLTSSGGRYKTIAEALSRKFSVMSIAVRGR